MHTTLTTLCYLERDDKYLMLHRVKKKEDVNKKDPLGWTALHYAAENGNTDLCKLLIEKGADVNQCTNHKMTPLHLAQNRQRTATAEYLISAGGQTWV